MGAHPIKQTCHHGRSECRNNQSGNDAHAGEHDALAQEHFQNVVPPGPQGHADADLARSLADGPTFAHGMTKKLLHQEWAMDLDAAIEAEAEAQAICMQTGDFRRAFDAFAAKKTPKFEGN